MFRLVKLLKEFLRSLSPAPVLASPVAADTSIMFARRIRRDDDYDDYDDQPRRRPTESRAARRFKGSGSQKSSGDMAKIAGITVGVLLLLGLILYFLKPDPPDVEEQNPKKGKANIYAFAKDIWMWKQKDDNDKLFPAAGEDLQPEETFLARYSANRYNPREGYRFYYSVSLDRKQFVVACEPAGDYGKMCYYIIGWVDKNLELYEAEWSREGDMDPPLNGSRPGGLVNWSQVDISSISAE